ncbi:MAG: hypothetical protein M5U14_05985 [Acidimicrobiia bacterium]|nr:hypothetical protein [Acidimicrobiia bacterium]
MSARKSRTSRTAWKPRRDRREVVVAVATGVGITLLTVLAVLLLRERDDGGPEPVVTVPTTVPLTEDTVPATGLPPETTALPDVTTTVTSEPPRNTAPPSEPDPTVPAEP